MSQPKNDGNWISYHRVPIEIQEWVILRGLPALFWIIGAILANRLVNWVSHRVAGRIDDQFTTSDELVRSEETKHRHAVVQMSSWGAIAVIYLIAAYNVIRVFGISITSFVAPATVLGAALGFGAQRIVQDLLAGFFIITEKQYGFGDVVQISVVGASDPAEGTVEDVTLRVTKLRSANGELITLPNGQIVKAVNLSKDWARAVVDIPLPSTVDIARVNEVLKEVGERAYHADKDRGLMLDVPSQMGVESIGLDQVNLRMVARTLPGKQFEVGRELRSRVFTSLAAAGITVDQPPEVSAIAHDGEAHDA